MGLFGYRRADVLRELEQLRAQVEQLAAALERGWLARRDLEAELETERRARAHLLAGARREADAIRQRAQAELDNARLRVIDLLGVRHRLEDDVAALLRTADALLADARALVPTPAAPPTLPARHAREDDGRAAENGVRRVELDVGPFDGYPAVRQFERSLASLPHVAGVEVRRFGVERAGIDVTVPTESPLVDELTQLPYRLRVTQNGGDHLRLELEERLPIGA